MTIALFALGHYGPRSVSTTQLSNAIIFFQQFNGPAERFSPKNAGA